MFATKQEEIIDNLLDCKPGDEVHASKVFDELVEANNTEMIGFSSYKLAEMWNSSDAVKFKFVGGKTAACFHYNENWKR